METVNLLREKLLIEFYLIKEFFLLEVMGTVQFPTIRWRSIASGGSHMTKPTKQNFSYRLSAFLLSSSFIALSTLRDYQLTLTFPLES